MAICVPGNLRRSVFTVKGLKQVCSEVSKGHFAVYVGESQRKREIHCAGIIIGSASFPGLVEQGQEFGFDHPTGSLTVPCREDTFIAVATRLRNL